METHKVETLGELLKEFKKANNFKDETKINQKIEEVETWLHEAKIELEDSVRGDYQDNQK